MKPRRILVTAALPYANGHIHIGHLVEYLQTDIWVRFQKLRGNNCKYFCADDTHGTAIMIRARQEGRSEEALVAEMQREHERDFAEFQIEFDNFGSTNSKENRVLCGQIWAAIRDAGLVVQKDVEQLYDTQAGTFLADRFVRGACPKCGAADQPGDNCSACGTTYTPAELVDPRSTLSGATPEVRRAPHLFIELEQLHAFLNEWTQSGEALQSEIANYLKGHFLGEPLRDWDISRPAPYFGFEIPDSPGNYWYVWFDAPIGYIASTQQWCDKHGEQLDNWWRSEDCEIHHFIGKDITYFHTLFWPGMLKTAGFRLPTKVHIHGFLTVDGEKMSKSKGTFVRARSYLNHLDPSYLRYFYASKLSSKVDDIDLSIDEFIAKVNTDLVGKVVNLASRTAKFVKDTGLSAQYPTLGEPNGGSGAEGQENFPDSGLFGEAKLNSSGIARAYEQCDYSLAMRLILSLADRANAYVECARPWDLKKLAGRDVPADEARAYFAERCEAAERQGLLGLAAYFQACSDRTAMLVKDGEEREVNTSAAEALQDVCTIALNLFRQIVVYLAPVLPRLAEQTGELLGDPITSWEQSQRPLVGTPVGKFKHMLNRVDPDKVDAMIEESKEEAADQQAANQQAADQQAAPSFDPADTWRDSGECLAAEPLADECTYDEFTKVDLRVARVVVAEAVEGADKLLRLKLSLGGGDYRQVFAGIKKAYDPEKLVGRLVICVANLAPRKMRFGVSEGMVVASGPGGSEVYVLSPDEGSQAGQRVH